MIPMSATLLFASTAAGMAAEPAHPTIAVPSGAEVWLQEELTDKVPSTGMVLRLRFVMPALNELVPPVSDADIMDNLPADMVDEPFEGEDAPLSPEEQAELDAALGEMAINEAVKADGSSDGPSISIAPALPGDGGIVDAPLPSELAAPDAADPDSPIAPDSEAMGDLAAAASSDDAMLPAAPDILMQDPVHRDIVWLCEHYALPRLSKLSPRPRQVVISMASAPSEFGTFDPAIVQLFEGFAIPADRDICVWEPI